MTHGTQAISRGAGPAAGWDQRSWLQFSLLVLMPGLQYLNMLRQLVEQWWGDPIADFVKRPMVVGEHRIAGRVIPRTQQTAKKRYRKIHEMFWPKSLSKVTDIIRKHNLRYLVYGAYIGPYEQVVPALSRAAEGRGAAFRGGVCGEPRLHLQVE